MKTSTIGKNAFWIFLINFLSVVSTTILTLYIFMDKLSLYNADRTDIEARSAFLVGYLVLPGFIIFGIFVSTISYFLFKKDLSFLSIFLGIIANFIVLAVLYFTSIFVFLFYPASIFDRLFLFGHYLYILILIVLTVYLIKKYKTAHNTVYNP